MTKMLSEIKEQPEVLGKLEEINRNTLRALTDELKAKNIKRVLFAARGTSYHACVYGQYLLAIRQGIVCAQAMPSCITLYGSSLLTEHDLVIGVSQSGDLVVRPGAARRKSGRCAGGTGGRAEAWCGNGGHHERSGKPDGKICQISFILRCGRGNFCCRDKNVYGTDGAAFASLRLLER